MAVSFVLPLPLRLRGVTCVADYGPWLVMMIVPEAANMPPTPWQTEILVSGSGPE